MPEDKARRREFLKITSCCKKSIPFPSPAAPREEAFSLTACGSGGGPAARRGAGPATRAASLRPIGIMVCWKSCHRVAMRNRVSIMSLCGCQHTCGSQGEAGEWLERAFQVLVWGEMHILRYLFV